MRILVTGGDGFIGSHLVAALARHEVLAVDKEHADLAVPGSVGQVIEAAAPDYVVHLGARYGRLLCRDQPHRAVCDNAAGTTELASVCAERQIPVLYSSSSEVYGDHGSDTIHEDSPLRMPTTIYGLSKRWGEEALRLYLPPQNLCIVRMNMVYGPRQQAGYGCCALATFVSSALDERPFEVHRGTSRSWLYVSDAATALVGLIEGGYSGIFNLGNAYEVRATPVVAEQVVAAVGCSPELAVVTDPPRGQIAHKVYDSSKLEKALGWQPRACLSDGIDRVVHHERLRRQNERPAALSL